MAIITEFSESFRFQENIKLFKNMKFYSWHFVKLFFKSTETIAVLLLLLQAIILALKPGHFLIGFIQLGLEFINRVVLGKGHS